MLRVGIYEEHWQKWQLCWCGLFCRVYCCKVRSFTSNFSFSCSRKCRAGVYCQSLTQLSLYVTYAAALFLHLQQVSIAVRINHNYFSKSVCWAFEWTQLSSCLWVGLFHGQQSRYHQSNIVSCSPAPNACTFFILWKQERDVIFDGGTEQSIHIVILASPLTRPPSVKHDAVPYSFRKWINVTDDLLSVRNWRCYETLNKRGIMLWPESSKQ